MLESDTVLDTAARFKAEGRAFALVTVVRAESPTSAKPGAKALVEADGTIHGWIGGGCAQPAVIKTVKQAIEDGQSRLIRISPNRDEPVAEGIVDFGMTCHSGGTLDIFIDPVSVRPALAVIGGSPAAQALVGLAARVGFAVTAAFPGADRDTYPDAREVIDGLEVAGSQPAFVVVATQGKRDEQGLEAALATTAGYIAFIASERKAARLRTYLEERGHQPARVQAIHAPAGLEIGAVTPEEIALSVLADLVRARRGGAVEHVDAASVSAPRAKPGVVANIGEAAEAIDPVCGMSVTIQGAEHTADYAGRTYYFCCAGCQHAFEKAPQDYLREAVS